MSLKEKLKCGRIPQVLQYHVPSKGSNPKQYAHHNPFIYVSSRHGQRLKFNNSCPDKLNLPSVVE